MGQVTLIVYQNNNSRSAGYKKYYGRVRMNSEIDVVTLCAHAAQDSGIEQSDVETVFDGLLKQIKELLCNGHPIRFSNFGTFKLGVSSKGLSAEDAAKMGYQADDPNDDIRKYMNASTLVTGAYLNFKPDADVKSLLNIVKFVTDKTEWSRVIEKEKEGA